MKKVKNNSNYITIPIVGTIKLHDINPNIYLQNSSSNNDFRFLYNTLLYTNMKYRITNRNSFHKDDSIKFRKHYIKEKNIKNNSKKMNDFNRLFKEIYDYDPFGQKDLSKYNDLFNNNEFPIPVCNYKSNFKKEGYFIIDYFCEETLPNIKSTDNLSNFLNSDFSNFDIYFEFFTKYFLSFINLFDEADRKNLKANHFYKFNEIEKFAKKYQNVILQKITKYQTIFRNFIDYTYNYTNDNDIKTDDILYDSMRRFLIFRRTNSSTFDYLINNIKNLNLFDVELFPVDTEKICDKKILLEKFNADNSGVHWGARTYTNNIFSFFYYIFYTSVFKESYIIKKCKNCNKYFFTEINSTQLYCDNIFSWKQTCKDIGNQLAQLKKQQYDLIYGKYRKIYSKKAMLVKRNPDIQSYKDDYENWKKEAQEYRNKLKNETITNEDFENWLENNK